VEKFDLKGKKVNKQEEGLARLI